MKILLVEDSKSIAAIMLDRLSSLGHELHHALNGQIAVDLFKKTEPDLILMDIEMPVMNGFEATINIRAEEATRKWSWTPIIFLTASDTQDNLLSAIEAGGDDFLPKKVPEPILFAKMKAMSRIAQLREDLKISNQKLEELAIRDPLTGLYNRRYLYMQLETLWNRMKEGGESIALLMIDIDNFKKYNDLYGHQAGDNCLILVTNAINSIVENTQSKASDEDAFVARYGGEEFTIIIPAAASEMVKVCAQKVHEAVQSLKITHKENAGYGIATISIGVKLVKPATETISNTFRQADAALYQSKELGRNRTTFS